MDEDIFVDGLQHKNGKMTIERCSIDEEMDDTCSRDDGRRNGERVNCEWMN